MMGKAQLNLQDAFLNHLRKEKIPVTVFLLNGFQIKGLVRGFDSFTVVIESEQQRQQMIYKHSISTVSPFKPVNISSFEHNSEADANG